MSGLVGVALGELLVDVASGEGEEAIRIAEDEGIVGDAQRRILACRQTGGQGNDIDRAEGQALVEITFLAELRRRINLDLVPAFGAPRDFL